LCQQIHDDVCAKGFDPELGAFTQSYGGKEFDASLLIIALLGFLPPNDKRLRGTVEAIERLLIVDGLVRRYDTQATKDGLPAGEGAFLACSFWLVDNFVLLGRLDDARSLFERSCYATTSVSWLRNMIRKRNVLLAITRRAFPT
jgi:GH15 family glucan-1,4-alpha-glucosidase